MPTPDDYSGQPGYRNFNPPPTTPDTFTRSNDRGGTAQHTLDPSNYNSPTTTQTAQAPPPPGVPVGTTYPPVPTDLKPPPPSPPPPPPEPAAKPLPNLGAWTPDQAAPWMHVKPIPPQAVPDRPPDTHVGTRPAWHPRPGEAGYGQGPRQPGNYTFGENLGLALQAGFTGPAAYTAAAIGMAESNGNPNSIHYQDGGKPWNSYGLMQINGSNDQTLRAAGINGAAAAVDPLTSYKAAFILSKGGSDFSPWSTFTHGDYKAYLDGNARPEASSTLAVGPRQEYRPPPGREAADWGRTPEHDWSPGNMPTAHDIPSIMGGLLPMALTLFAGLAGGQGALGAITFFSAYQTARNKGQLEAAKEAKTQWQDKLKETQAALKEELLEASGLWAQYGNDYSSPGAQAAWGALAAKYDDRQLRGALESGNSGAIEQLFKKRDEAYQTVSKTSDAQSRADEELAEKERKANEVNAGLGLPPQPVREPGGGTGTPAPERPWENRPSAPVAPPPSGGPAGVTAPSGGTTSPAAAAPPPASEESPSPEEPPPQAPAAAPAPPGTPSETLPPVSVSAPADDPLARLSPQEQAIARDVLAGGEMPKFPPEAAASETRIESAVAGLNQKLRQVGENPNLKDENAVVSAVRRVDPLTGDNLALIAHNQMPLPGSESGTSGSGGSRGVLGYRNLMSTLAHKINPQWDPGQWGAIEKFRDPQGQTQRAIGRITAIGDAGTKLQEDLKHIPDNPTQFQRQLDQFARQGFTDDPAYSNLFTDWQTFIIDSNALTQGGQGLEGETEQMIKSIPKYGQKSAYEGALKRHASFALSRYQQYQNQWSQLQRTDAMFGHNDVAEKQIRDLANIDESKLTRSGTPLPSDLPPPAGHAEGSTVKDSTGKVVAKIQNGQWVPP